MIHFHPLTVKDIRRETAGCVSVAFEVPPALQDLFQFKAGQSLTLRTTINGEELRRTYSLCCSPLDGEWRVAIKQVEGGLFSTYANTQLKPGDVLDVMPPVGKFNTPLSPAHKKTYLAFAAGSGITPILSIIKTTLHTEPDSAFILVYGNRDRGSIIFKEALEALKNTFLQRFTLHHVLSRERVDTPLNQGRIDKEKLQQLAKLIDYRKADEVFVCGPETMIFAVKEYMEALGMDPHRIHFELFTTPGQKTGTVKKQTGDDGGPKSNITIKLDGIAFDFKLGFNESNILDAALAQGADLPYACKGGVCCTCKARLVEGEVDMDVHWGLEPEEVEAGFILTCQSHPKTEKVVMDFDAR